MTARLPASLLLIQGFLLRKLWDDEGQARMQRACAGRRPSAASYCTESDASEVAASRGQTDRVGTNGIQKDLEERD